MPLKQELTVGSEVPDIYGNLYKIIADRSAEGFTDTPPIVAMALGINNRAGTSWKINDTSFENINLQNRVFTIANSVLIYGNETVNYSNKTIKNPLPFVILGVSGAIALPTIRDPKPSWTLETTNTTFNLSFINAINMPNCVLIAGSVLMGDPARSRAAVIKAYSTNSLPTYEIAMTNIISSMSEDTIFAAIAAGGGKVIAISSYSLEGRFIWCEDPSDYKSWNIGHYVGFRERRINSVYYGNNKFIAVGDDGFMAKSADGITWQEYANTVFGADDINCITYKSSKWVCVGNSGKIATSTDGDTWSLVSDSKFDQKDVLSVDYGNNMWIAVGKDNKISYSRDALTWTTLTIEDVPNSDFRDVAYLSNAWIIAGTGGVILTSNEGKTGIAGLIKYFNSDGSVDPFHLNTYPLDVWVEDVPPHDYDSEFMIEQGKVYRTRGGRKVYASVVRDSYKLQMSFQDGWSSGPLAGFTQFVTNYDVWYTGRRYTDKTDDTDVMEEWKEEVDVYTYVVSDKYNPLNLASIGPNLLEIPQDFSDISVIPAGKGFFHLHMRESLTDGIYYKLVNNYNV